MREKWGSREMWDLPKTATVTSVYISAPTRAAHWQQTRTQYNTQDISTQHQKYRPHLSTSKRHTTGAIGRTQGERHTLTRSSSNQHQQHYIRIRRTIGRIMIITGRSIDSGALERHHFASTRVQFVERARH